MIKLFAFLASISIVLSGASQANGQPKTQISSRFIRASLYLPDSKEGYYRGSRFDWSGVISDLQFGGHTYFGQWFEQYNPTSHDAIMGPVEAYSPVGYNDAKPGQNFLIIGVGMVAKPEEPKYSFVTPYKITNAGSWRSRKKRHAVIFTHELNDEAYSYLYTKGVELDQKDARLVLTHTLKNTGKQNIETDVYNHNFFVIDKQPVGVDYVVKFPYAISGEARGSEFGTVDGNQIKYLKDLSKKDHLQYLSLQGFSNSPTDYDIRIENQNTGAGVRITSDQPLSKMAFWSAYSTICPEPYTKISVAPGEEITWTINYDFYTLEKK